MYLSEEQLVHVYCEDNITDGQPHPTRHLTTPSHAGLLHWIQTLPFAMTKMDIGFENVDLIYE